MVAAPEIRQVFDMSNLDAATLIISALISAVTSGLVALGVEWLAKPRLEARKERILAKRRAEDEIIRQLLRIQENSIRLSKYPSMKGMTSSEQTKLRSVYEEFIGRIREATGTLDGAVTDLAPGLKDGLYSLFTGYLGLAKGTLESNETYRRKFYRLAKTTLAVKNAYNRRQLSFQRQKRIALAEHILRNLPSEEELNEARDDPDSHQNNPGPHGP